MVLPRRVPWLSQREFDRVFSWLFESEGDINSQQLALDKISVWVARGSCPQAIEATADLFDATLHVARRDVSPHSMRLMCAMALIRFVNGLVDPLQQGYYARSIGSIAAQLGLPLYFVEVRHAATHEHLPSFNVLRDATRKALDWLFERYWCPQQQAHITGVYSNDKLDRLTADLAVAIRSYRRSRKRALKDASKVDGSALMDALKTIQALCANIQTITSVDDAFDALASVLTSKGGLPYKTYIIDHANLTLPQQSLDMWQPLLNGLSDDFTGFEHHLLLRLLDMICTQQDDEEMSSLSDATHSSTHALSAWVVHLLSSHLVDDSAADVVVRKCLLHPNARTLSVLHVLSNRMERLRSLVPIAKQQVSQAAVVPPTPEDVASRIDLMQSRLLQLQKVADPTRLAPAATGGSEQVDMRSDDKQSWQLYDEAAWRPCPIGCLPNGGTPELDWPRAVDAV